MNKYLGIVAALAIAGAGCKKKAADPTTTSGSGSGSDPGSGSAVVAMSGSGSGSGSGAGSGSGSGSGSDAAVGEQWNLREAPKCPASARPDLENCLGHNGPVLGNTVDVDPTKGTLPDFAVVRAGGGQGTEIYVIAKAKDTWHAVREVFYEQGHGKGHGELTLVKLADEKGKAGAPRVTRIDFKTSFDVAVEPEELTNKEATMFCTWPASGEAPTCSDELVTKCDETVGPKKSASAATVALGDDGKPVYKVTKDAPGTSCELAKKK